MPATWSPFESTMQRSSGFMKPFDTPVGVQRKRSSAMRMLMFPSLAAAKPRLYRRRPTSQISSRSLRSLNIMSLAFHQVFCDAFVDVDFVDDASRVGVHRLLFGMERRRGFRALRECDPRSLRGA